MKILVINSGSSSIKFQLLDMESETVLASGLVERIAEDGGLLRCTLRPHGSEQEREIVREQHIADHQAGMRLAVEVLSHPEDGVIQDQSGIDGVGHRVVHGGEDFHAPTLIDDEVIQAIEKTIPLAPLHNPPNLDGIRVALELFPETSQVAVFDTAFHQTIPPKAHIYALPYELYEKYRVRRYGFHGTSHKYVAQECAKLLGKPFEQCNLITIHLGNGCSMAAIENGKSVDTSLGLTPLEGLVMGTRSGDLDPAIHAFLARNAGMSIEQLDIMLNKNSGLKGICGRNDLRDIHSAIKAGDSLAELALEIQTYRNRKYIGAYMAVLGRVDAIIFTAGIGENDPVTRQKSVQGLSGFGLDVDRGKNDQRITAPTCISKDQSKMQLWVIPTNEELAIARETKSILKSFA